MATTIFDIESFSFVVPEFSEEVWRDAINREDGFRKSLLITQAKTASLLRSSNDKKVTPARLAWMNLWTKCFSLIDGTYAALSGNSTFVLEVLERIAIEMFLHAHTIAEPHMKPGDKNKESVVDRLCAYTAWALSQDVNFIKWDFLKKSNLDMIWDPNPARNVKYNPRKYEAYKSLFGEITIDTDTASLRAGRKRQEEDYIFSRKRIDAWLEHPELISWQRKIRVLAEQVKPNSVSFFMLFKDDEKAIRTKLKNIGLGFGYLSYKQKSMLIHGSTIEQMNLTLEDKIIPRIQASKEEIESSAELVHFFCDHTALCLAMMKHKLWP